MDRAPFLHPDPKAFPRLKTKTRGGHSVGSGIKAGQTEASIAIRNILSAAFSDLDARSRQRRARRVGDGSGNLSPHGAAGQGQHRKDDRQRGQAQPNDRRETKTRSGGAGGGKITEHKPSLPRRRRFCARERVF
jgi:hypothetical protein